MCLQGIANAFNISNDVLDNWINPLLEHTVIDTVVSGCVAGAFGVMNPVGGVIFGATAGVINGIGAGVLSSWAGKDCDLHFWNKFRIIPLYFASAGAAMALTTAVGFPMTWMSVCACAGAIFAANALIEIGKTVFVSLLCMSVVSQVGGSAITLAAGVRRCI